ncbi:MAG: helix-turn-helix domain-containing protein [Oscillospiraceae bacterium]|nr:helix-turn-helix domain-containing protein [Oscillospiraceae bacterium]
MIAVLRALLVDDDEMDLKRILTLTDWDKWNSEVVSVCDSSNALKEILRLQPDVVFTEALTDHMDGLDLIGQVKDRGVNCDFIIVSRYKRFGMAQRAMRLGVEEYLTKPVEAADLERVLEKYEERKRILESQDINEQVFRTRKLLRNSFMESFTGLNPPNDLSIENLNNKFHFHFRKGVFQTAILVVDGLSEEEQDIFLPGMAEALRARLDPICYEVVPLVQGWQRLTVTINYDTDSEVEDRLSELLDVMQTHLHKRGCSDMGFCIGVGLPVNDISRLHYTLETAERAVRCGILQGRNKMYRYGKMKFDDIKSNDILTSTLLNELHSSAAIMDFDSFSRAVHSCCSPISPYCDPAVVIDLCHAAINEVIDACGQMGYEISEEEHLRILHLLGDATSLAETESMLLSWTEEQMKHCVQERHSSRPIWKAKEYIASHYTRTLTLEEISKVVHLNASYLSIVFKKETGQNFSDYLTSFRIEKAKDMLRQSDLSVASIGEAVGYADSKYFSRIFTRQVGLKPSAYRALQG